MEKYYWEEDSYIYALLKGDEKFSFDEKTTERIKKIENLKMKNLRWDMEKNQGSLEVCYKDKDYSLVMGFFDFDISIISYLNSQIFSQKEKEEIEKCKKYFMLKMKFSKDPLESFHLQIKILHAIVPDMVAMIDESSERFFNSKWVNLTASSYCTPSPDELYSIQAVSDGKKDIWLHTHGLLAAGSSELEILDVKSGSYYAMHELIRAFANRLIDNLSNRDENNSENFYYLGISQDREPIIAEKIIWKEALKFYPKNINGSLKDREKSHNTDTSVIFLYKNEEDIEKNKRTKPTEIYERLSENPIYILSDRETKRMKNLAKERISYLERAMEIKSKNPNFCYVIAKIGLEIYDDEKNCKEEVEHIWFEIEKMDDKYFTGILTQEPYYSKNFHEGDNLRVDIENLTDWVIYVNGQTITPDTAYILDVMQNNI